MDYFLPSFHISLPFFFFFIISHHGDRKWKWMLPSILLLLEKVAWAFVLCPLHFINLSESSCCRSRGIHSFSILSTEFHVICNKLFGSINISWMNHWLIIFQKTYSIARKCGCPFIMFKGFYEFVWSTPYKKDTHVINWVFSSTIAWAVAQLVHIPRICSRPTTLYMWPWVKFLWNLSSGLLFC